MQLCMCMVTLSFLHNWSRQFVYGQHGLGLHYRDQLGAMLGIWHTYKQLNMLVWHRFLRYFLAGAIHALNKDSKVFIKPKLIYLVSMFSSLRQVWPSIERYWSNAFNSLPASQTTARSQLLSLKDLFTFRIPLVCIRVHICVRCIHTLFMYTCHLCIYTVKTSSSYTLEQPSHLPLVGLLTLIDYDIFLVSHSVFV